MGSVCSGQQVPWDLLDGTIVVAHDGLAFIDGSCSQHIFDVQVDNIGHVRPVVEGPHRTVYTSTVRMAGLYKVLGKILK